MSMIASNYLIGGVKNLSPNLVWLVYSKPSLVGYHVFFLLSTVGYHVVDVILNKVNINYYSVPKKKKLTIEPAELAWFVQK